jgi:hypothetical protein
MTQAEARDELLRWREYHGQRDTLIRQAHEAGVTKTDIHRITGIARTTIDSILAITDDNIRALRDEAGSAGDLEMVRVCDRALSGGSRARRECEQVILDTRMRAAEDDGPRDFDLSGLELRDAPRESGK